MGRNSCSKVIVCAGQPLVRAGIRSTLENDAGVTVEADVRNLAAAADVAGTGGYIVVLDENAWPVSVNRYLYQLFAANSIVFIAGNLDPAQLIALLYRDVKAVVCKSSPSSDLIRAIRMVQEGDLFVAPEFVGLLVAVLKTSVPRRPPNLDRLTPREREVMELVCRGMPNRAIARNLGVGEKTVKFHVSNLLNKMLVHNRSELIAMSMTGTPIANQNEWHSMAS